MYPNFEIVEHEGVSIETPNGPSFLVDSVYAEFIQRYTWRWQDDGHSNLLYPRARVKYKLVRVHRYIYQLAHGSIEEGLVIHHINHNTADNRLENLKAITHGENVHLSQKHDEGRRPSQYRGVYWNKRNQKWYSLFRVNGKNEYVGCFDDEVTASCAFIIACSLYNVRLNNDDC